MWDRPCRRLPIFHTIVIAVLALDPIGWGSPQAAQEPEKAAPPAQTPAGQPPAGQAPAPPVGQQPAAGQPSPAAPQTVQVSRLRERRAKPVEIRLSLEDAVRMGLENNLDIRVSRLDDDIRERELIIAKATFDPFFNMGVIYAKNRDPSVSFLDLGNLSTPGVRVNPSASTNYFGNVSGTSPIGTTYQAGIGQVIIDRPGAAAGGITRLNPIVSTEISLTARQPLLRGGWYGVNTAGVRIAENNRSLSKELLELTAINTVRAIEQAYWEVAFATKNVEAKMKALQVTSDNLDNVRKKKDVGTLAAIDVTTAESQVALRRVDLEEADLLLENTRDRLLELINYMKQNSLKALWESGSILGPFDNVQIVCTTPPSLEPPDLDRNRALLAAFEQRSEYKQLELNVDSQQIRIDVAKNGLLPNLDLVGSWSQLGLEQDVTSSFGELESGKYYSWTAGVEFSVPLSLRGPRSIYRNARDELRKLQVSKADLENIIVLEVDQAIRTILSLARKVRDLDERVRLQQELLRAERLKLDVGKSIAYAVSVIENDLVDNVTQALRAKADYQTAKVEFLRATGELLDHHRIEVVGGSR